MPKNIMAVIRVRVLPRSSKNRIADIEDNIYKIKLTAPPIDGKANKALQQFLSKKLGIPKTNIEIISGERSRVKSIKIHGLSDREVEEKLRVQD